jgi:hypothetical protein
MSTDLYGVRVLDVAPDELRARFRIFVVYYDTHDRSHAPLPDDPSFFFQLLWEAARDQPVASVRSLRMVDVEQICDPEWVAANSHRFVRRIERVAVRNYPVADDGWAGLYDFYYNRDGGWRDEDLLVQADFDIEVTDSDWLEPLTPGVSWATTAYPLVSDQMLADDAPTVLDLREPAVTLDPFPNEKTGDAGTPSDLVFSDDGRYLAVTSQACELVVLRIDDWSEQVRVRDNSLWGQDIQWVPGTHRITGRVIEGGAEEVDNAPTRAYDVDNGTEVDVPAQPREFRSRTGRYRADGGSGRFRADGGLGGFSGYGAWVGVQRLTGESYLLHLPRGKARVNRVSFTDDEARMFVSQGNDVHILDPETGDVLNTINGVGAAVTRPDGAYLAAVAPEANDKHNIELWRVSDGALLMRCRSGGLLSGLNWSPDGSMLASSVITGYNGYGGEVRIYRGGPRSTCY